MGLSMVISLLFALSIVRCNARGPLLVFHDPDFKILPFTERMMAALVIRDVLSERNLPSAVRVPILPRKRINLMGIMHAVILTRRATPPEIVNALPLREANISVHWSFNVEPACSKGFRLSKPPHPVLEDLIGLTTESRSGLQSNLPESSFDCSPCQWKKQTVRAGTIEIEPFILRSEVNGNVKWSGIEIDIFTNVAETIGFNYLFFEPPDKSYGLPANMSGNGLVGMAFREEIDVTVSPNDYDSQPFFDIVYPTTFGIWVLVIPPPTIIYDLLSNAKPFNFDVWLCVVVSLVSVSITMWMVTKLSDARPDLGLDLLYNVSLITGQGGFNPKYLPGRFLAAAWNLGAFILVFSYTSILISFVTARLPQPLLSTFEDFVTKRTLLPVAQKGLSFSSYFLEGNSGFRKEIGDIFRANPESITETNSEAIELGVEMAASSVYDDFKSTKQCRMTVKPQYDFTAIVGWNTSKLVPALTRALHYKILTATESGLILYYQRKYVPKISCFSSRNSMDAPTETPLILIQLQTAFLILGIGIFASATCFVWEICNPKTKPILKGRSAFGLF